MMKPKPFFILKNLTLPVAFPDATEKDLIDDATMALRDTTDNARANIFEDCQTRWKDYVHSRNI